MKHAFCSSAIRDGHIEEIVPRVAAIGYDGIEIWGPHLEEFLSRRALPELRELLAAHSLAAACLSPHFDFVSSDASAAASLADAHRCAAHAAALGTPLVRTFTGPAGSAGAHEEQWDRCVDALREACDAAAPQGISFALETQAHNPTDTTPATLLLLNRVGRDNLHVSLDIFSLFAIGEDAIWSLNELYPYVAHVHVKNRREGRPALLDEGEMEYAPFLTALHDRWYGGYLSLEWFGPDPYWAAEETLAYLRSF